jgi:hypothetical protein
VAAENRCVTAAAVLVPFRFCSCLIFFLKKKNIVPPCSKAQHAAHAVADLALVLGAAIAPHLGGLDVGWALVVGLGQHAHDGDEDFLHRLDGAPPLRRVLVVVGIVAGRVQDRDAHEAAGVDCVCVRVGAAVSKGIGFLVWEGWMLLSAVQGPAQPRDLPFG